MQPKGSVGNTATKTGKTNKAPGVISLRCRKKKGIYSYEEFEKKSAEILDEEYDDEDLLDEEDEAEDDDDDWFMDDDDDPYYGLPGIDPEYEEWLCAVGEDLWGGHW